MRKKIDQLFSGKTIKDIPFRSLLTASVLLLIGMIVTTLITFSTKADLELAAKQEFDFASSQITQKIVARLDEHAQILYSGSALFAASESVTRLEWQTFTRHLPLESLPGIQGVGYSVLIPAAQLSQHIQQIRTEGFPDYTVRPEGKRDVYTSIVYLEPFSGRNLRAFGYDMFSEPVRRAALERARDENSAALSGKVALVQENGQDVQAGTLLFVPVYQNGLPVESITQRRAALRGWVYSPYRMNDLMNGILGDWNAQTGKALQLEISDGEQLNPDQLLYYSQTTPIQDPSLKQIFSKVIPIEFGGQRWNLRFTQTGIPASIMDYGKIWMVFLSGTMISLLLSGLLLSWLTIRINAQKMAARMTVDLRLSEEKIRAIINSTDDVLFTLDHDQRYNGVFGHWLEKMQRTPDFFLGHTTMEIIGTQEGRAQYEANQRALAGETTGYEWELADGVKTHQFHMIVSPLRVENGQIIGILGLGRDITEFKRVEQALLNTNVALEAAAIQRETALENLRTQKVEQEIQNEKLLVMQAHIETMRERYFNLYDLAPVGYCTLSESGVIQEANLTVCTLLGVSRSELFKQSLSWYVFKSDLPVYKETRTKFIETGLAQQCELRMLHQDGAVFWALMETSVNLETANHPASTQAEIRIPKIGREAHVLISDISERKQMEINLQEYAARLEISMEAAKIAWWEWDYQTGNIRFDNRKAEMVGFTPEYFQLFDDFLALVHPDDYAYTQQMMNGLIDGSSDRYEIKYRIQTKSGDYKWLYDIGTIIKKDRQGKPLVVAGIVIDIDEREQVEALLKDSEERLSILAEYSRAITWEVDAEGLYIYISQSSMLILGYAPDEIIGLKHFFELHPADEYDGVKKSAFEFSERLESIRNFENSLQTKDGQAIWVSTNAIPILDRNGKLSGYRGADTDISERKRVEQALALTSARLSLAVHAGGVGIWDYDLINDHLIWDEQMYHLYGITMDTFSGANESWLNGVHPQDRERGNNEIQAALHGEKELDTEFRVVWPDGSIHDIHALAVVQRDAAGKALSLLGTNWDVTEQKNALDRMQASVEEKDALLREVHHRVKNNLAAILALINLQESNLEDPKIKAAFRELGSRVSAMALVHELLYNTESLAKIDLQKYLERLTAQLGHLYQRAGDTQISVSAHGVQLDLDTAIPCGLIVTEQITNSFMYAFPGGLPRTGEVDCKISISATQEGSAYTLKISDNGAGLPAGFDWKKSPTLGMSLIRMLGEHQLGATIQLDATVGTSIELTFISKHRS